METRVLSALFVITLTTVYAAPVDNQKLDDLANALKSQLKDQEKALASLGTLTEEGVPAQPLGISESKSFSYSNINGAVEQEERNEQKVTNPEAQEVISDMKQHVQQKQASPDTEPETAYDASLDVPAVGIHKEISSNDDEKRQAALDMEPEAFKNTVEFTPEVVAQYLYDHEAKADFLILLRQLVETSEITSEEAEQYEKTVMDELYKLEQATQGGGNNNNINGPMVEQMFPQALAQQPLYPVFNEPQAADDMYPLYGYGQVPMKAPEPETVDNYINYMMNKPVTLDDMINSLLDEWLTKAVVTGDPEAEEILTNIVDYVSRDNNPNDEEQVKEVLGDIFAEALLEDLTPRIQPSDLKDIKISPQSRPEVIEPEVLPVKPEAEEGEDVKQVPIAENRDKESTEEASQVVSNNKELTGAEQQKMK